MAIKKMTTESFIEKAKIVHGNKYDYSLVVYNGCQEKVKIICPEHGEFKQTPAGHLTGRGCPICRYISSGMKRVMTKDKFIEKAREIHGDKYDYSKVNYINNSTKVCIICHEKDENGKEHGEFWQTPTAHLDKKQGCPRCTNNHRYTTQEFLENLPDWIKERYDFSEFEYVSTHKKSTLICPEHGKFLISPHNIRKGIGCPSCSESKIERELSLFLEEYKAKYVREYKEDGFGKQTIDFFLPDFRVAIECQGIQHFQPTDFAGRGKEWAEQEYKHNIELDCRKQILCNECDIKLIYFTHEDVEHLIDHDKNTHFNGFKFYTDKDEMMKDNFSQNTGERTI